MNQYYKCQDCNKYFHTKEIIEMKSIKDNVVYKKYKCINCYNKYSDKKTISEVLFKKKERR